MKTNLVKIKKDLFLAMLPEEYPQTVAFLCGNDPSENDAYQFVTKLLRCDTDKTLHPQVFNFAVSLLESEISKGNCDAMNDLGALYYTGRGGVPDYSKAVYYYKMGREHGSIVAEENLGYCYYYGRSIPIDYEKAFQCFAFGAAQGRTVSTYKLGDMYLNGFFVDKDINKAFLLYRRCLGISYSDAPQVGPVYLRLGDAYLNGIGTEVDAEMALSYYQKAEILLYRLMAQGETYYAQDVKTAIEGQNEAREKIRIGGFRSNAQNSVNTII